MHPSRFYPLTALFLTVLYTVVGATGPALHYLCDAEHARSPAAESSVAHGKSAGYVHCHGPDCHWHHHESPVAPDSDERSATASSAFPAWSNPAALHSPHDCPLLAIVATLKLSRSYHSILSIEQCVQHAALAQHRTSVPTAMNLPQLPRGPPRATWA
jgi:hypothetical protein